MLKKEIYDLAHSLSYRLSALSAEVQTLSPNTPVRNKKVFVKKIQELNDVISTIDTLSRFPTDPSIELLKVFKDSSTGPIHEEQCLKLFSKIDRALKDKNQNLRNVEAILKKQSLSNGLSLFSMQRLSKLKSILVKNNKKITSLNQESASLEKLIESTSNYKNKKTSPMDTIRSFQKRIFNTQRQIHQRKHQIRLLEKQVPEMTAWLMNAQEQLRELNYIPAPTSVDIAQAKMNLNALKREHLNGLEN